MAGKTNAVLAAEYIAAQEALGMEVFKEWRTQDGEVPRQVLFIVPKGQGGNSTSFVQLRARLAQWLKEAKEIKSAKQINNITTEVGERAELRGGIPHQVAVQIAAGWKPKKKKK